MTDHQTSTAQLPPVTVVMTTWAPLGAEGSTRRMNARMTLDSWQHRLRYEGPLYLHVADDGSALPGYPEDVIDYPGNFLATTFSRQERHGVGASLNAGFRVAFEERGGLALYAVDDWLLLDYLDITPWARALVERNDIGMVRLGPPHPGLTGRIDAVTAEWQGWGLHLDRHHYAFGHRPALYHPRMRTAYGIFAEDVNAYDCERLYAERFAAPAPHELDLEPGEAAHGWVRPRTDGAQARCGGPALCSACQQERERYPGIVLALPHPWMHLSGPEHAGVEPKEQT